jgi:CHAD domain-containing protein
VAIDLRAVAKRLRKSGLLRNLRKEAPAARDRARGIITALLPSPLTSRPPPFESRNPARNGNGASNVELSAGLAAYLGQMVHKRLGQLAGTLDFDEQDDPIEALHDLRVASRRLRAFVKVFEPLLEPSIAAHVGKPLRRVTKAAGELRDIDVQMHLIDARMSAQTTDATRAALELLLERLHGRRDAVKAHAKRRLRKVRQSDLNVGVAAALGEVVARLPASSSEAARLAWTLLEPILDDMDAHDRAAGPASPPDKLHELRISIKKLRYALELVGPLLGEEQRELVKKAESLQELLGTYHDLNVIAGLMEDARRELEARGRKTLPFGLSVLRGELDAEERALVDEFQTIRMPPGYFRERVRSALEKA